MPKVIHKIKSFFHLALHRGLVKSPDPYSYNDGFHTKTSGAPQRTLDCTSFRPRCSRTFIKNQKTLRFVGFTSSFVFLAITVLTISPIVISPDTAEGTAGVVEVPSITITSSSNSANLEIAPASPNGTFSVSSSADQLAFNVSTNNYTGYTLKIKASDDNQKLSNTNLGTTIDSITTATDASTFANGSADTYSNKWGYLPSVYDSIANTNFLPAPTTAESILDETSTSGSHDYTIGLGARVDYNLATGVYTNTYTLTAVANPVAYAINYYDGVNSTAIATQASAINTAANVTLSPTYTSGSAPTRSTYTFKAWCKGTVNSTVTANYSGSKVTSYSNPATVCTGTEYADGTSMPIDPTLDNTDIKLYAVWTPTTFDQAYAAASKTKNSTTNHYQMQDINSDICNAVTINQYGTLTDSRDNQNYTIGKLEDGRCWMADNLNFDAYTYKNVISAANTHFASTLSSTEINNILTSFKSGNRSAGNQYATSGVNGNSSYATGGNWLAYASFSDPLINRSGSCSSSSEQCLSPYQNNNYTYDTVIDKYGTKPGTGSGTATITYNIGPGSYKVGAYHNFCAASLGSYCYGSGSGNNGSPSASNATDADICPSAWRLPTGSTTIATNEFRTLFNEISVNHSSTTAKDPTSPYSFFSMFSTPFSGLSYAGGVARRQGWGGYFYGSTYTNTNSMTILDIMANEVGFGAGYYRFSGYSIRCIAQEPYQELVNGTLSMQEFSKLTSAEKTRLLSQMSTGTSYTVTDERDSQTYTVAKLADGNVWMTQNLKLGKTTTSMSLTTANSDVPSGGFTLNGKLTTPKFTTSDGYTNNSSQYYCSDNYGCYYNWYTATAGSGTSSISAAGTNVNYSICPVGWTLPTEAQHIALTTAYGGYKSTNMIISNPATTTENANGEVPGYLYSGSYNNNGGVNVGQTGSYHSSTASSQQSLRMLRVGLVDNLYAYPSANLNKYVGAAVRCLLK